MASRLRVIAAMSGGVDSAVAAARAIDAGHDVVGVHLALSSTRESGRPGGRGCCTLTDAHDARRAADLLGIPFYVWDLAAEFEQDVLDDFVAEYAAGRTPNPCIRCNEKIKFAAVLDRAVELGFDAVCTGHYARIVTNAAGQHQLHRAADQEKDQSYVLGVLTGEQITRSIFPLGDSLKSAVRVEADQRGLLVADKPDSHDICFIPDGNTVVWLRNRLGAAPGNIVDSTTGEVLGQHQGTFGYTVGQRRGLGIRTATADGAPRYVVGVDPRRRIVGVGPATLLDVDLITAIRPRWVNEQLAKGRECSVQILAHGEQIPAVVVELVSAIGEFPEGRIVVRMSSVVRGVAPGQTMVLYDGTRVLGSATISRTGRSVGMSS